ncbi:hypothetical protein ES707_06773 [subsurface metagenome]
MQAQFLLWVIAILVAIIFVIVVVKDVIIPIFSG